MSAIQTSARKSISDYENDITRARRLLQDHRENAKRHLDDIEHLEGVIAQRSAEIIELQAFLLANPEGVQA